MSVARNILKNPKLVPGGGATELTVSATLKQKSSSVEGIEKVSSLSLVFFFFLVVKETSYKPIWIVEFEFIPQFLKKT